jgi:hypothetical protein
MLRQEKPKDKKKNYYINYSNIFACTSTTLLLHPLRVGLNSASTTTNPVATVKAARSIFFKSAHYNLARGLTATSIQSTVKDITQELLGNNPLSRIISLGSAGFTGTFASPIETYFMRNNALLAMQFNHHSLPKNTSKLFYNRYLFAFYLLRECAFVVPAFGFENAGQLQRAITYILATYISSSAHKFVAIESTKDILNITTLVPNWSDGFIKVFSNISKNKYGMASLKGMISNPKNNVHYIVNLVSATCHLNMFAWRFGYIYSFSNLFSYFRKRGDEMGMNRLQFFKKNNSTTKESESNENSLKPPSLK